jgi:FMN reductase
MSNQHGSVVVVVGNPKPRSRTLDLALRAAREVTGRDPDAVYDLCQFGPLLFDMSSTAVAYAVTTVCQAKLAVVASPTYKGTYTGLLKLFLDRFAAGSLNDVIAIPLMVAASGFHAMAGEVLLKPVLAELGALLPTRSIFIPEDSYEAPYLFDDWLAVAGPRLRQLLGNEL